MKRTQTIETTGLVGRWHVHTRHTPPVTRHCTHTNLSLSFFFCFSWRALVDIHTWSQWSTHVRHDSTHMHTYTLMDAMVEFILQNSIPSALSRAMQTHPHIHPQSVRPSVELASRRREHGVQYCHVAAFARDDQQQGEAKGTHHHDPLHSFLTICKPPSPSPRDVPLIRNHELESRPATHMAVSSSHTKTSCHRVFMATHSLIACGHPTTTTVRTMNGQSSIQSFIILELERNADPSHNTKWGSVPLKSHNGTCLQQCTEVAQIRDIYTPFKYHLTQNTQRREYQHTRTGPSLHTDHKPT